MLQLLKSKRFISLCLLLAVILRLSWIVLVSVQPASDYKWYYEHAVGISQGLGYTEKSRPTAYWPVGYPAFLGLLFFAVGPSVFAAKVANILLYLGILLLTYRLARSLFRSEITARMALFILSIYPNHIAYSSLLSAEILALFLSLCGMALLLVSQKNLYAAIVAGVVFGLGTLTRPQILFLPVLFFLISFFADKKQKNVVGCLSRLAVVYPVLFITLAPWMTRNYREFRHWVIVSNNDGINLLIGNNPYANGRYHWDDKVKSLFGMTEDEYVNNSKARVWAIHYISDNPLQALMRLPYKFFYLYFHDVEGIQSNEAGLATSHRGYPSLLWMARFPAQLCYVLVVILFLLRSMPRFLLGRNHQNIELPHLGLGIIVYFTTVYLMYFGSPRFHFIMIPWMIMYAADQIVGSTAHVQDNKPLNAQAYPDPFTNASLR